MIYRDRYTSKDGRVILYALASDRGRLIVKWDDGMKELGYKRVALREGRRHAWKCTRTGVSCLGVAELFELFEKFPAYANATVRYYSGLK